MNNHEEYKAFFQSNFSGFDIYLKNFSDKEKENFWSSVFHFPLEEWRLFFSLIRNKATIQQKRASWDIPSCFTKEVLQKKQAFLVRTGRQAFLKGEVAMLTVAGGLGTRLKFNGPKGLVPVTPLKRKTLFQVFAEKIRVLSKKYGKSVHWLIMTSDDTDEETQQAFRKNQWYDLNYVHFFKQGNLPSFLTSGINLFKEDGSIRCYPDGHGGIFNALKQSGLFERLEAWKISTISYFQVDNPLVNLDDCLFLGLHKTQNSEFSTKVVRKRSVDEKVGVFVLEKGKLKLTEYCEIPKDKLQEKNNLGELAYCYGNTAIHLLSVDFLKKCAETPLPYHVVRKKMDSWDPFTKKTQNIEGFKLEQFIFDALPWAQHPILYEVSRSEEFSPVKNYEGSDSLSTCIYDQCKRWQHWLEIAYENKREFLDNIHDISKNLDVEISPSFADNLEDFLITLRKYRQIPGNLHGLYLE